MAAVIVSPSFPVNLEFLSSFSTRAEENQWYRIPVAHRQHMPGRGRYLLCRDHTCKARSLPLGQHKPPEQFCKTTSPPCPKDWLKLHISGGFLNTEEQ